MERRTITVTLAKAREWFSSGNAALREVALQAFDKTELMSNLTDIKTFQDACKALNLNYSVMLSIVNTIKQVSRASAAMFRLNIVRKALNLGTHLHFVENPRTSCIYYPNNPFITKDEGSRYYSKELNSGILEVIGEIRSGRVSYYVLNGPAYSNSNVGLGSFRYSTSSGDANASTGFLGCASKEIAEHFGKYFGMLITEAKYADVGKEFEIVESKYAI